jgi:4-hydroxy-tetrahydrodipicolinate reductase
MTRVTIVGSRGRMGHALLAAANSAPEVELVAAVDAGDALAAAVDAAEVVIDFSVHTVTASLADRCAQRAKALVIGTTGHTETERTQIAHCQSRIPLVWSANFSMGVNTLFWLTRKAAEILGPAFDVEVVEMHHRHKQDAPSGTAKTLAEILAEALRLPLAEAARHGRHGFTGERTTTEIGVHAVRGGDVVGDHTVIFAGRGERIELTHRASNRETFAHGALRAAVWAQGRAPGLYTMQDVLGLR